MKSLSMAHCVTEFQAGATGAAGSAAKAVFAEDVYSPAEEYILKIETNRDFFHVLIFPLMFLLKF